jgi:hypothetical protein
MIRGNLATRPFYNEAGVNRWLIAIGIVVAAATAYNVTSVLRYSGGKTELGAQSEQDEQRAAALRATAQQLRKSVDPRQIEASAIDARQANDLIDRRMFSWTELFNRFEATLPDAVRITAVRPGLDHNRRIVLSVVVLGRTVDDINQFMERLDTTGQFRELRSKEEHTNDDNQIESLLEMIYLPQQPKTADVTPKPVAAQGRP